MEHGMDMSHLQRLKQRRHWLEREIQAYYCAQTLVEQREDHFWSKLAATHTVLRWQEEPILPSMR